MTTDELRDVIQTTVSQTIEDTMEDEDWLALDSPRYVESIAEARENYRAGRVTPLDDLRHV